MPFEKKKQKERERERKTNKRKNNHSGLRENLRCSVETTLRNQTRDCSFAIVANAAC